MAGNAMSSDGSTTFPATPDTVTLQQMQNPTVMVTKLNKVGPNKVEPQLIISPIAMSAADIMALQNELPVRTDAGPGVYRFEVTDDGGQIVRWQTRLGAAESLGVATSDANATASGISLIGRRAPTPVVPTAPSPVNSETTENLGNGFIYNRVLRVLTSPDGRIFPWQPGTALPVELTSTPALSAPSTPLSALPPMFNTPNPEVETLRRQLEDERRENNRREEQRREEETRRREREEINARFANLQDGMSRALEAVMAKVSEALTSKGPSPAELELARLREKMETREALADLQRQSDEKLERTLSVIRESQMNRGPDPAIQLLTSFITQIQQTNAENMRILREAGNSQLELARLQTMTPDKLLTVLEKAKGDNTLSSTVLETMGTAFEQLARMNRTVAEMQGGGGGTDWAGIIRDLGSRVGGAVTAVAQYKAQEAKAAEAKSVENVLRQRAVTQAQQQQRQTIKQVQAIPAKASGASTPATTLAAQTLDEAYFGARGVGSTPPAPVATPSLTPGVAEGPATPTPAPTPTPPPTAVPAPLQGDIVAAPFAGNEGQITAEVDEGESEGEEDGEEEASKLSPEVTEAAQNALETMEIEEVRKIFDPRTDEEFFGSALPFVTQLREALATTPKEYAPENVADFVMQAREHLGNSEQVLLAAEMLAYGQIEYFVERLIPKAKTNFQRKTVKAIEAKLAE